MNNGVLASFIAPGFLLVIGCIVLAAILFFYYIFRREKEFEDREGHLMQNYDKIIEEAHAKAKEIIDQASVEASTLLTQAQSTKLNLDMKTDDTLKRIADEQVQLLHSNSEDYFKGYQAALDEVKKHYTDQLNEMLAQIRQSTEKEFAELKNIFASQVNDSQTSVKKEMQNSFAQTQIEINEYKKHELEKIDQSVSDLLLKISQDVLGKVIPIKDHQSLILDSLESAKKEGMFTI